MEVIQSLIQSHLLRLKKIRTLTVSEESSREIVSFFNYNSLAVLTVDVQYGTIEDRTRR